MVGRIGLGLLAGLALCACEGRAPEGPRPSVLLVTVDTLRADRLGCYGYGLDTSPEIDALAAGSVLFERALAGSSATAPSHASIFSGRFTRGHSVGFRNGDTALDGVPTLSTKFREAGWATGAFVGNFVLRRGRGFERGFEVYDDELPDAEANRGEIAERVAEATTERALAWLEAQAGQGRPFFLWVHYQDPHGPYAAPGAWRGRFLRPPDPSERPLPALDDNSGERGIPAYQRLGALRHPSLYTARYAEEILYADHWVGELVRAVDAAAGEGGAVVALTADHGESFGEGDEWFVHRATTPEVAHVPLLLRAPGLAPGRRSRAVHHVDLLPTLLEWVGLPVPAGVAGAALGPWLRGEAALPERLLYTDIGEELSAYAEGGDAGPAGFLRVSGAAGAWSEGSAARGLAPHWERYAWPEGGAWQRVPTGDFPVERVNAYLRQAEPMRLTRDISAEDEEKLRALGYID